MLAWNDIETLLLDLDGTLLDLRFDTHFWLEHLPRRYAEINGFTVEAAKAEIYPRLRREAGTLKWYCLDHWSGEFGVDILALKREVAHLITAHRGVEAFLTSAKNQQKRLVLVTNAHGESLALKMRRTGLTCYFDQIICSHALGAPKEDARFWTRLAKCSPFDPARTLFIDDSVPVLRAARKFGLTNVVAIRHPDSGTERRIIDEFPALDCVNELLPAETA